MPFRDNVRTGMRRILSVLQKILTWIWNVIGFIAGRAKENKCRLLVAFVLCVLLYIIYVLMKEYIRVSAELLAVALKLLAAELELFSMKLEMERLEQKLQQLTRTTLGANNAILELE